jgi:hypothetical protein
MYRISVSGEEQMTDIFDPDYAKGEIPEGTNFAEGYTIGKHAY